MAISLGRLTQHFQTNPNVCFPNKKHVVCLVINVDEFILEEMLNRWERTGDVDGCSEDGRF